MSGIMAILETILMLVAGVVLAALGWGIVFVCRSLYDNDDSGGER